MSTLNAVNGIGQGTDGANAATSARAAATLSADLGEDRFLKLLIAQMRNQDPLNPLDNAQVTTQMAQISTVSGIDKLNQTLKALAGGFAETQSLQAAALVGREVLVAGAALELDASGARGGFELAEPADEVVLEVKNASGIVVHRAELGAQAAGVHYFEWDGGDDAGTRLAAGAYSFQVSARRADATVKADPLAAARVLGVARDASGTSLDLQGLGRQPYGNVKQIL